MTEVIWTESAVKDYWDNIEYCLEKWGETVASEFLDDVNAALLILQKANKIGVKTSFRNIRCIMINKHISRFYKTGKDKIVLIRFWNNLQNPESLTV